MPIWTDHNQKIKITLIIVAVLIATISLIFSHKLTRVLLSEEVAKMEVWSEAMRSLTAADEHTDLNLVLKVINSNNTIPVIVTDGKGNILASRNISPEPSGNDSLAILKDEALRMKEHGKCLQMNLTSDNSHNSHEADYIYVYYEESVMLKRLTIYPYIQLGVVGFFMLITIFALLASKRAEQNRVWVGLSRETAHQLGTPISSLMAWSEVLRESYPNDPLLPEMDKDVHRLQLIAERFSKIGSAPELSKQDLCLIVQRVVEYFDRRTSQKVVITFQCAENQLMANINAPLFEWVIENLCKNAVDAMEGAGNIHIQLEAKHHGVHIEVSDTGKGMAKKHFKTVFKPGFTTKKRGWGLGLSLAKRIIEEYHHGHIYVKESEIGKGTVFAIDI